MDTERFRITYLAATVVAAVLIALAYWPGLNGPFLFDDFSNLDDLGAFAPLDSVERVLLYLTSGTADPTGRPVSLLSFLIDARDWPAHPAPFKRTNLILHLINTVLLAATVARLQAALHQRVSGLRTSRWTPLLAAALWGAHPFLVSTTLYVVQREAMLPMTFVLLALLAWDRSVRAFTKRRNIAGWLWATFGFGTCTMLAGLSKANGFLAPVLVLLAYAWLLRPQMSRYGRSVMDGAAVLCLALPSVLVLAYLANYGFERWSLPQLRGRDWTIAERLLTQPRALWDYMWHLALPRAGGGGVFVEGFAPSRGWLSPSTTLPAAMALLGSIVAAIAWRRRFPIASFSWLFFLAGHLLESSVIALELYFEHRNYLPAAFLGWPLAHVLLKPGQYARYRRAGAALLLGACLLLTNQRAIVWGDAALLAALTARHETDSTRSQVVAAQHRFEQGDRAGAINALRTLQHNDPDSVVLAINTISLECAGTGHLSVNTLSQAVRTMRTATDFNYRFYEWLRDAASTRSTRECRGFGVPGLVALVEAAETNPRNSGERRRRDLWHVRGHLALAIGRPEVALAWFDAALRLLPDPDYALSQAAALGNAGNQELGIAHLDRYASMASERQVKVRDMRGVNRWLRRHYGYYREEFAHLRRRLSEDVGARPTPPP